MINYDDDDAKENINKNKIGHKFLIIRTEY